MTGTSSQGATPLKGRRAAGMDCAVVASPGEAVVLGHLCNYDKGLTGPP
jgi:hypothetical protein